MSRNGDGQGRPRRIGAKRQRNRKSRPGRGGRRTGQGRGARTWREESDTGLREPGRARGVPNAGPGPGPGRGELDQFRVVLAHRGGQALGQGREQVAAYDGLVHYEREETVAAGDEKFAGSRVSTVAERVSRSMRAISPNRGQRLPSRVARTLRGCAGASSRGRCQALDDHGLGHPDACRSTSTNMWSPGVAFLDRASGRFVAGPWIRR